MAFEKGKNNADARRGKHAPGALGHPEEKRVAARALYEGDPQLTQEGAAKELGVSVTTLRRWAKEDGWKKLSAMDMSERANMAADTYTAKLIDMGPEVSAEAKAVAEAETRELTAVELRAGVIDRHRKEWSVPRALIGEAVKGRDFEKAKLAKITSEALQIIQSNERKAWGLDQNSDGKPVTVVIERD